MPSIEQVKREIVAAQVRGEPTDKLERALKDAILEQQVETEVAKLHEIATQRLKWQNQADKIKERVVKQDAAIDTFISLRDSVTGPLKAVIEKAREAGLLKAQEECYVEFHDPYAFGGVVSTLPKGYLPDGYSCPALVMASGQDYSYEAVAQAIWYLNAGYGLLMNLKKGQMTINLKEFDDGLGKDSEGEEEAPRRCSVCDHPSRDAINKALLQGRSLRDIEAEFDAVSRSSLSRHKQHLPAAQGAMSQEKVGTPATAEVVS